MIFALGVVLFIVGAAIVNVYGGPTVMGMKFHNTADYYGAGTALVGFVLALGSMLHFTARVLA